MMPGAPAHGNEALTVSPVTRLRSVTATVAAPAWLHVTGWLRGSVIGGLVISQVNAMEPRAAGGGGGVAGEPPQAPRWAKRSRRAKQRGTKRIEAAFLGLVVIGVVR